MNIENSHEIQLLKVECKNIHNINHAIILIECALVYQKFHIYYKD